MIHANAAVLSLVRIRKSYGANVVLNDITVSFQSGEVTALVGPNGAGKTTLCRIAAGLQFPDSGRVIATGAGYFGGFETLPVKGTVDGLWRSLGLQRKTGDGRRLSVLSRGELQWVGLEAIFALGCKAILLDEPWMGLEPDRKVELSDRIIRYVESGNAAICASHELDEVARIADRVYVIGNGKIKVRERTDGLDRDVLLKMYRDARTPP